MPNLPTRALEHNQTRLQLSPIAQDLLCWTQYVCPTGELATAERKRLRHRLLHVAGRIVRPGRGTRPRLQADRPGAATLAAAFPRLRAIPALCRTTAACGRDPDNDSHATMPRCCAPPASARPGGSSRTAASADRTAPRRTTARFTDHGIPTGVTRDAVPADRVNGGDRSVLGRARAIRTPRARSVPRSRPGRNRSGGCIGPGAATSCGPQPSWRGPPASQSRRRHRRRLFGR